MSMQATQSATPDTQYSRSSHVTTGQVGSHADVYIRSSGLTLQQPDCFCCVCVCDYVVQVIWTFTRLSLQLPDRYVVYLACDTVITCSLTRCSGHFNIVLHHVTL